MTSKNRKKKTGIQKGEVWLVGAGPGDPGLLTIYALEAIKTADVLVYDALVADTILNYRQKNATLIYAGKRGGKPSLKQDDISTILIKEAKANKRVCRLKGGDPFVFGRGAEETAALKKQGIKYRIVPGITSGIGGLAYAGIPLTSRDTNSAVIFLTGHGVGKNDSMIESLGGNDDNLPQDINWQAVAFAAPTLVLYMAIKNAELITKKLIVAGRDKNESVAIISNATTAKQRSLYGELCELPELAKQAETPAIVVVGKNADLASELAWWRPE
ncbi:MAG: uroporphyrinogen-III C-methyltransferase [Alphaproteobacteria bacterium]